jgi:hypothetical protein
MDAMKEALKRKMELMKGGPKLNIEIGMSGDDEQDEEESDMAPSLDGVQSEQNGDATGLGEGDPQHLEIMKAMADGGSMGKHQAGGLHARAADAAKGKFELMKKGIK